MTTQKDLVPQQDVVARVIEAIDAEIRRLAALREQLVPLAPKRRGRPRKVPAHA